MGRKVALRGGPNMGKQFDYNYVYIHVYTGKKNTCTKGTDIGSGNYKFELKNMVHTCTHFH